MVTLVIADESPLFRRGLRGMLSDDTPYEVVGEFAEGKGMILKVIDLKPSILLLSLNLPGAESLPLLETLQERAPAVRVLCLAHQPDAQEAAAALRHGAMAYIPKSAAETELCHALEEVSRNRQYITPSLATEVLAVLTNKEPSPLNKYEQLTKREREILKLAAQGMNRNAIAKRLVISPRTVETHRANLMQKLEIHSQTELVRFAVRHRLVLP
jgi:two-component system, NarL family, response regulator NreC